MNNKVIDESDVQNFITYSQGILEVVLLALQHGIHGISVLKLLFGLLVSFLSLAEFKHEHGAHAGFQLHGGSSRAYEQVRM